MYLKYLSFLGIAFLFAACSSSASTTNTAQTIRQSTSASAAFYETAEKIGTTETGFFAISSALAPKLRDAEDKAKEQARVELSQYIGFELNKMRQQMSEEGIKEANEKEFIFLLASIKNKLVDDASFPRLSTIPQNQGFVSHVNGVVNFNQIEYKMKQEFTAYPRYWNALSGTPSFKQFLRSNK